MKLVRTLREGAFATMRNEGGYFTVYAVNGSTLLAVLGSDGLNVARLHLEARPTCKDLAALLAA
jgi:uncharacterized protein